MGILCGLGGGRTVWAGLLWPWPGTQGYQQLRTNFHGNHPAGCVSSSSKPQVIQAWGFAFLWETLCCFTQSPAQRQAIGTFHWPSSCWRVPALSSVSVQLPLTQPRMTGPVAASFWSNNHSISFLSHGTGFQFLLHFCSFLWSQPCFMILFYIMLFVLVVVVVDDDDDDDDIVPKAGEVPF